MNKLIWFLIVFPSMFSCQPPSSLFKLSKKENVAIEKISQDCDCIVKLEKDADVLFEPRTDNGNFWIDLNFNKSMTDLCQVEDSLSRIIRAKKYAKWFLEATSKKDKYFPLYKKITIGFYSSVFPNERTEDPICTNNYTFSIDSLKLIEYSLTDEAPVYLDTTFLKKRINHKITPMPNGEGYLLTPIKTK